MENIKSNSSVDHAINSCLRVYDELLGTKETTDFNDIGSVAENNMNSTTWNTSESEANSAE